MENGKLKEQIINLKIKQKKECLVFEYNEKQTQDDFINKIASSLSEGAGAIEIIGDKFSDNIFLDTAKKVKQLCEIYNATFIIRNRADIAYLSSADCVNLDNNGLNISDIKEIAGHEILIGKYVTDEKEVKKTVKDGADYLSIDKIPSTPTTPVTSTGIEYAKWVSENNSFPVLQNRYEN